MCQPLPALRQPEHMDRKSCSGNRFHSMTNRTQLLFPTDFFFLSTSLMSPPCQDYDNYFTIVVEAK